MRGGLPVPCALGCSNMGVQFWGHGVQGASNWLFPLVNGAPPIGWHDAIAYLVLPVLLVVSQYASQKLLTPQTNDDSQQSAQWILKFLPLMIGGRSLHMPLTRHHPACLSARGAACDMPLARTAAAPNAFCLIASVVATACCRGCCWLTFARHACCAQAGSR